MYLFEKATDLTHNLRKGMPIYPGDPTPSFENYSTLQKDGVNLTKIIMGSHTGTHLDAPRHFIQDGIGIDRIPPDKLIGEAYVADLSKKPIGSGITSKDLRRELDKKIVKDDIVIVYTGCSKHWGEESINSDYTYLTGDAANSDYTYLTGDAANYLVSKRVRAVGIDFLSVEKFKAAEPVVHRTLLGKGIFIIESLSDALKQFVGKRILMICMPIKLRDGDGAPARVVAVPIRED